MSEKELLFQLLTREISNLMGDSSLRIFAPNITKFLMTTFDQYIDAFIGVDEKINTKAAGEFLKEEVSQRIDLFMKKYDAAEKDNNV